LGSKTLFIFNKFHDKFTIKYTNSLLWEEGIDHECRLSADDGKLDELQIEVEKDTLDKLLKNYILDLDEYNKLYQAKVDFIILI